MQADEAPICDGKYGNIEHEADQGVFRDLVGAAVVKAGDLPRVGGEMEVISPSWERHFCFRRRIEGVVSDGWQRDSCTRPLDHSVDAAACDAKTANGVRIHEPESEEGRGDRIRRRAVARGVAQDEAGIGRTEERLIQADRLPRAAPGMECAGGHSGWGVDSGIYAARLGRLDPHAE